MQTKRGSIHPNPGSIQPKSESIQTKRGLKQLEPGSIQSCEDENSMFGINSVPNLCKPFLCKACPEKTGRIQNLDIPRAGRFGAPGGTAGRGLAEWSANRLVRPGITSRVYPRRDRKNVA